MSNLFKFFFLCIFVCISFSIGFADINDGLVAWYTFDGDVLDASGNEFHGTVNGLSFVDTEKNSKAAYLNGTTDYISVNIPIDSKQDWCVAFWCKIDKFDAQYTDWQAVISNIDDKFELGFRNRDQRIIIYDVNSNNSNILESENNSIDTEMSFVCFIKQDQKLLIYKNSKLIASNTKAEYVTFSKITTIGMWSPTSSDAFSREPVHGWIDDLRIYNRSLTKTEINDLYLHDNKAVISGCIELLQQPLSKNAKVMLMQSGELFQSVPLDKNGCYKFYKANKDKPFSVLIRKSTE